MKISLKLEYNPYRAASTFTYRQDSLPEMPMKGRLSRVSQGNLQNWLIKDGDWKGLFHELYDAFGLSSMDLFFTGLAEDYRRLTTAYQEYALHGSMTINFYLNPANLPLCALKPSDKLANPTELSSLKCFEAECKYAFAKELMDLLQELSTVESGLTRCQPYAEIQKIFFDYPRRWKKLVMADKSIVDRLRDASALFHSDKETLTRMREALPDTEEAAQPPEAFYGALGQALRLCGKYEQVDAAFTGALDDFLLILQALGQETNEDVYTVSVDGVQGGWVEAGSAAIRQERFVRRILTKYSETLREVANRLKGSVENTLLGVEPAWHQPKMQPIREKRCMGQSRRLQFDAQGPEMVEYIDLQDLSRSFVTEFERAERDNVLWWMAENRRLFNSQIDDLEARVAQIRRTYDILLLDDLFKLYNEELLDLLELKQPDREQLGLLNKHMRYQQSCCKLMERLRCLKQRVPHAVAEMADRPKR